ncbi:hypothetical protein GF312_10300 [Candidatus Poribacteria bacterium]|nr:hypothetical protein [Candidatus Poribacteria bacterium]
MIKTFFVTITFCLFLVFSVFPADDSLILYLSLDEGQGNVAKDSSNHNNDGEIVGNTNWVDGKSGSAVEFISGSYIIMQEIPEYDVTDAVSLMAWVKTNSVTTWARVIDKSQWQDNGFDLALSQATHAPLFEFFVNNTTSQALGVTPVDDGDWHFIAGTFGNKKLRIYVDGVMETEVTSANEVDIKPNDWPITIGVEANNLTGQPYVGVIDEVAIYNRELSADNIESIFQNGIDMSSPVDRKDKVTTVWGDIKKVL